MTLFTILPLEPLYFLMFLLISMSSLAFLDTLVHGWCKWSQSQLRNHHHQFCFCAKTVPSGLGENPCIGLRQPLQEGFTLTICTLHSATPGCPTPNPTGELCTVHGTLACCGHPEIYVFNHEHPGVRWFIVTWLPTTDNNKPCKILGRW